MSLEELNVLFINEFNSDIFGALKYGGYEDLSGLSLQELWTHAIEHGYKNNALYFLIVVIINRFIIIF